MKQICSINGLVQPLSKESLSLATIEVQYNFGVYETIKVRNKIVYFLDKHIDRLLNSAYLINLKHQLSLEQVSKYVTDYVEELHEESCNLKMLLYGGNSTEDAQLIILASAPYYPNRKWYNEGVKLISFEYERWMPQAKTLNMLPSYFYYKEAKRQDAYDALLLDRQGNMLEGTRTNVFFIKDRTIVSPPKEVILEGVTLMSLEKIIASTNFDIIYRSVPFHTLNQYDGMILSSTSSKIIPVKQVDAFHFPEIVRTVKELVTMYEDALHKCKGEFEKL